ncbi:MAG: hypothetical protein EBR23_13205, partial [Planctomycetia bacterium]|nr:hypothetical protein [Planctomycetia bacterium]
ILTARELNLGSGQGNVASMGSVTLSGASQFTAAPADTGQGYARFNGALVSGSPNVSLTLGGTSKFTARYVELTNTALALGANAQLNALYDLRLRGGSAANTAAFNVPLGTGTTGGGAWFGRTLGIADSGSDSNVSLTLNSGASSLTATGDLYLATGDWRNQGTLNVDGRTLTFAGSGYLARSLSDPGNNSYSAAAIAASQATLNLTNGARLNFGGNMEIGRQNGNDYWDWAWAHSAKGNISVDATSQLNIAGDLYLRGGRYLTSDSQQVSYNLPLSSTAGNGFVSFGNGLRVAGDYHDNVALTVGTGSATTMKFGGDLTIAPNGSRGVFTLDGPRTMEFSDNADHGGWSNWGVGSWQGYGQAVVNVQNGATLLVDGNVGVGAQNAQDGSYVSQLSAINVTNGSKLGAGSLNVYGATISVDSTSRVDSSGNLRTVMGANAYYQVTTQIGG